AAITRGINRVVELYSRIGAPIDGHIAEMLDSTERRVRAGIRELLTKGTYEAVDWLDEDGISGEPVRLAARLIVDDDKVVFDLSDCSPQLGSGKNIPLTHTLATVYFCLKAVVDPLLPINEGLYRTVDVLT